MTVAAVLAGFAALPPPEGSLAAWAARVGTPDGEFPLIGAGTRAETYVALQWNGERCASLGPAVGPTLAGLAVGAARRRSAAQLSAAVEAGLAAAAEVSRPTVSRPTVSRPTVPLSTGVLAATVCAARLAEVPADELPALLDLAASLMVIGPPGVAPGHDPAAAWLALRAWDVGITGMPGGLAHTFSVVSDGLPERASADLDLADLIEALP